MGLVGELVGVAHQLQVGLAQVAQLVRQFSEAAGLGRRGARLGAVGLALQGVGQEVVALEGPQDHHAAVAHEGQRAPLGASQR